MAPVRPDQVCGVARGVLTELLATVDARCSRPGDCALYPMQYNPCDPPLAFARSAEDEVRGLGDTLRTARELCHFVAAPCPAPVVFAACEAGRCVVRDRKPTPEFFARLSSDTPSGKTPLASVKVTVQLFNQPNCITAPCPAMPSGQRTLQTDAEGLIHFELGEANKATLIVERHEPATIWPKANDGPNDVPTPYALKKKP